VACKKYVKWLCLVVLLVIIYIGYFSPGEHHAVITDVNNYQKCGVSFVRNGGFEDAFCFWVSAYSYKHLDGIGRKASRGVCCSLQKNNQRFVLSQDIALDQLPGYVLVEGWIRTEKLNSTMKGKSSAAGIGFGCLNPDIERNWKGREIYGQLAAYSSKRLSGTNPWTKLSFVAPIHPKTTEIFIEVYAFGTTGEVYFDDVNVYPVVEKQVQ